MIIEACIIKLIVPYTINLISPKDIINFFTVYIPEIERENEGSFSEEVLKSNFDLFHQAVVYTDRRLSRLLMEEAKKHNCLKEMLLFEEEGKSNNIVYRASKVGDVEVLSLVAKVLWDSEDGQEIWENFCLRRGEEGGGALHQACEEGHYECVAILLKYSRA